MDAKELERIIENHRHWLYEDIEGWETLQANLTVVDFSDTNLRGANLRDDDLIDGNLRGINLRYVDLRGIDYKI